MNAGWMLQRRVVTETNQYFVHGDISISTSGLIHSRTHDIYLVQLRLTAFAVPPFLLRHISLSAGKTLVSVLGHC
jgi:hypothetical protein